MWGPSPVAADPIFPGKKNWRPFLVITIRVSAVSSPKKLATFSLGSRPLFPACKKITASFVLAPFYGAPVRPNMLNMPKSAAASEPNNQNIFKSLFTRVHEYTEKRCIQLC